MLTLHHNEMSTCSQKVRLTLAEKNLEWKSIHLRLRKGEQFDPHYLRLNPRGVVPTLIHDDWVIRESSVILEGPRRGPSRAIVKPRRSCCAGDYAAVDQAV